MMCLSQRSISSPNLTFSQVYRLRFFLFLFGSKIISELKAPPDRPRYKLYNATFLFEIGASKLKLWPSEVFPLTSLLIHIHVCILWLVETIEGSDG